MQDSEAVQSLPGNDQQGTRQLREYKPQAPNSRIPVSTNSQSSPMGTTRSTLPGTVPMTIPEHPDETDAAESLQNMNSRSGVISRSASESGSGRGGDTTLFTSVATPLGTQEMQELFEEEDSKGSDRAIKGRSGAGSLDHRPDHEADQHDQTDQDIGSTVMTAVTATSASAAGDMGELLGESPLARECFF